MAQIVSVGSANYDFFSYTARFPSPSETMKALDFKISCGGKGANQAVMAAKLFPKNERHRVAVICKLGNDSFGDQYSKYLEDEGLTIDGVLRDAETNTGVAQITVSAFDSENWIVISPGANDKFIPSDLELPATKKLIENCKVLLLQNEIPQATTLQALRLAKDSKINSIFTIFTPAPVDSFTDHLFQLVDLVLCNALEGLRIIGDEAAKETKHDPKLIGLKLLGIKKCKNVIVTLGKHGCVVVSSDGEVAKIDGIEIPSEDVQDTVGAGDAFAGSVAFFKALGLPLVECARRATYIAAMTVQKKGTVESYPNREEFINTALFSEPSGQLPTV